VLQPVDDTGDVQPNKRYLSSVGILYLLAFTNLSYREERYVHLVHLNFFYSFGSNVFRGSTRPKKDTRNNPDSINKKQFTIVSSR
jgi:hypothetical protein